MRKGITGIGKETSRYPILVGDDDDCSGVAVNALGHGELHDITVHIRELGKADRSL